MRTRRTLHSHEHHFSHILDPTTGHVLTEPKFSVNALRANLILLCAFTYFTTFEVINGIGAAGIPNEDLLDSWNELKKMALPIVGPSTTAG